MSVSIRNPASKSQDPGRDVALALFVAWLILVGSGFWLLIALPARQMLASAADPARSEAFESWLAREEPGLADTSVVVVDPARDCACEGTDEVQLAAFLQRVSIAGVAIAPRALAARPLPDNARIAVFGANGRLRYAGPLRVPMFCSGMATLADAALRDPSTPSPALVLPSACSCRASESTAAAPSIPLPEPESP